MIEVIDHSNPRDYVFFRGLDRTCKPLQASAGWLKSKAVLIERRRLAAEAGQGTGFDLILCYTGSSGDGSEVGPTHRRRPVVSAPRPGWNPDPHAQRLEHRHFFLAWIAPRRPEVEHHDAPAVRLQTLPPSLRVFERKFRLRDFPPQNPGTSRTGQTRGQQTVSAANPCSTSEAAFGARVRP